MRPAQFDYKRPQSVDEALELMAEYPEYKLLAGGHSLIPAMNLRLAQPAGLIDLGRLDSLRGVCVDGDEVRIGALTTYDELVASKAVQEHVPALATAVSMIGDPQVRAWGTLGGNLAHADPASDPPPVILASDGRIKLKSADGDREVPADEFFVDIFATSAKDNEILSEVIIPSQSDKKSAYVKLPHPASRYPIVGICVVLDWDGDQCSAAKVAVGGLTPRGLRIEAAEEALAGSDLSDEALKQAAALLSENLGDDLISDHYASADYRRAMAGVFLKRAIRKALS